MAVTVYYDFTCAYSYRASRWLSGVTGVDISWSPFLLKEANRGDDGRSVFDDDGPPGVALLALMLAEAAKPAGFRTYFDAVYDRMQGAGPRPDVAALRDLARGAGVDLDAFDGDQPRWRRAVGDSHAHGRDVHAVFGTPTLLFDDDASVFLKLTEIPSPEEATRLWESLHVLAVCHPELVEIKRPVRP